MGKHSDFLAPVQFPREAAPCPAASDSPVWVVFHMQAGIVPVWLGWEMPWRGLAVLLLPFCLFSLCTFCRAFQ